MSTALRDHDGRMLTPGKMIGRYSDGDCRISAHECEQLLNINSYMYVCVHIHIPILIHMWTYTSLCIYIYLEGYIHIHPCVYNVPGGLVISPTWAIHPHALI